MNIRLRGRALIATLFLGVACSGHGQTSRPEAERRIDNYIESTWDLLTRSTNDCNALGDPKSSTLTTLYIPYEMAMSDSLRQLEQRCGVGVVRLPKPIKTIGDVQVSALKNNGLLYLPHDYVVPGGRFNDVRLG